LRANDGHQLGHAQAEARQLPAEALACEGSAALPGAVELEDVGTQVVGLDDGGQRAALPRRSDVAAR
jgi:hypothetical protein